MPNALSVTAGCSDTVCPPEALEVVMSDSRDKLKRKEN